MDRNSNDVINSIIASKVDRINKNFEINRKFKETEQLHLYMIKEIQKKEFDNFKLSLTNYFITTTDDGNNNTNNEVIEEKIWSLEASLRKLPNFSKFRRLLKKKNDLETELSSNTYYKELITNKNRNIKKTNESISEIGRAHV